MADLLLTEELFLLTHDDESGRGQSTLAPGAGEAGALLLDLADAGLIEADGKKIVIAAGSPAVGLHPLLADALAEIRGSDKPRTAGRWLTTLQSALKPLDVRIGRSLVERGVLGEEPHKTLGLFTSTRWPELDPGPERELRARLTATLVEGAEPSRHIELLIALLVPLRLIRGLVDKEHRKIAEQRAKTIAEASKDGKSVSGAVSQAVLGVQTAVMVAVMTPVIVSS